DQRLNESPVVARLDDILHEGAVDFNNIDAELAQVAEGGMAGAEIVDGDAAAEVLDAGDEAARVVDILDCRGLGDLDDQPGGRAAIGAQHGAEARPPIRIDGGSRRDIN